MKKVIFVTLFVLFIFKPYNNFAIGSIGSYVLTGHALSKTGDTLKNIIIVVCVNNNKDTLVTDSIGRYKTIVKYYTACPNSVIPWPQRWKDNKLNAKNIDITFNNIKIKIKNDWKRMMANRINYNDIPTKVQDLIFIN